MDVVAEQFDAWVFRATEWVRRPALESTPYAWDGIAGVVRRHVPAWTQFAVWIDLIPGVHLVGMRSHSGGRPPLSRRRGLGATHRSCDRRAFKRLMADLYLTQRDGTLTTAMVPVTRAEQAWSGGSPLRDVLEKTSNEGPRLLRLSDRRTATGTEQMVSLGHDALAPAAAGWKAEQQRWEQLRRFFS